MLDEIYIPLLGKEEGAGTNKEGRSEGWWCEKGVVEEGARVDAGTRGQERARRVMSFVVVVTRRHSIPLFEKFVDEPAQVFIHISRLFCISQLPANPGYHPAT